MALIEVSSDRTCFSLGRGKLQIAQTNQNQNLSGEILLQTFHHALNKPNINLLTYTDEIERFDPVTTFTSSTEMPISIAVGILTHDMTSIFKISPSVKDIARFTTIHNHFVRELDLIHSLWERKNNKTNCAAFQKVYPKYNKNLNFLQQHLRSDECDLDVANKRESIRRMAFYQGPYKFYDKRDISPHVPTHEVVPGLETRFANYDGMAILSSQPLRIRVPKTQHPLTRDESGGVAFAFDTQEESFCMIRTAIENATPSDLKKDDMNYFRKKSSVVSCGSLSTPYGNYYIELRFRHNMIDAKLPSTSSKIVACLTNVNVSHTLLCNMITDQVALRSPANLHALGRYLDYYKLIQKKIKQLMNHSFSLPEFPLVCIDCYRPGCNQFNVYQKAVPNAPTRATRVVCTKCRIAEFCLKCTKASHGGECDQLDEATAQLIRDNTRPCPRCMAPVEKNGGCNHMSCRCGAHFCWTCNQSYERNHINDHYIGMNPYEQCRGIAVAVHVPIVQVPVPIVQVQVPVPDVQVPVPIVQVHIPDEHLPVLNPREDQDMADLLAHALAAARNVRGVQMLNNQDAGVLLNFLLEEDPADLHLDMADRELVVAMLLNIVQ